MSEHQLTNPRVLPDRDAACGWCLQPLYQVVDLYEIVTPRRGGPTFCCDLCWSEWCVNGQPDPMTEVPFIVNAHTTYAQHAPHAANAFAKTSQRRPAHKSVARQTGETAANVIGFAIWLVFISIIATALLAILR